MGVKVGGGIEGGMWRVEVDVRQNPQFRNEALAHEFLLLGLEFAWITEIEFCPSLYHTVYIAWHTP